MAEIMITEEKIIEKDAMNLGYPFEMSGELKTAYFIDVSRIEKDEADENKEFLIEFLIHQQVFPLYISFVDEYGLHEEHDAFFKQNKLSYVVLDLDTQFRSGEVKVRYKEYHPCYTITVQNAEELRLVLNKTYWLASENLFYTISYSDNLSFKLGETKWWRLKLIRPIGVLTMHENMTRFKIAHDGNGFYLLSNDESYIPIEHLMPRFPKGTVISQINDDWLLDDETD
ncbi:MULTISPECIES: hypothetical protein [unclassified Exiguobacterium]|uniref:hypothetical protein n=1 Tax=unclassified Exiguobacterium TaxID=2644629 RepID=UPI001BE7D3FD|nr:MULTISPECIES: hypothetical protein [unclassified Exiguobacterium]